MSAAAEAVSDNAPQIAVEVDHVTKIYPGGVEALNDMKQNNKGIKSLLVRVIVFQ